MIATKEQRAALWRVYTRTLEGTNRAPCIRDYRRWRRTVQQGYDCYMVQFAGMWLGIERDGYTHS